MPFRLPEGGPVYKKDIMRGWGKLGVYEDQEELILAQHRAFSRQIPLMYCILLINAVSLAKTFYGTAPDWLTLYGPGLLCAICILRILSWWRTMNRAVTVAQAARQLRTLVVLAFGLSIVFTAWALTLFGYGTQVEKLHVAYFMSATVFACTICLTHMRAAAVGLLCITIFSLVARLLMEPYGLATVMAFNGLLVAAALIAVLFRNYDDFAALIQSKKVLAEREWEALQLFTENRALAVKDALTALPNRRCFFAELEAAVRQARAAGSPVPVVAVIDLDGFKPVNDLHGHVAGDRILVEVARRLERFAGDHVQIARLGGDEFAAILTAIGDEDDALRFGDAVCQEMRQIYEMGEFIVRVSASIGVSEIGAAEADGAQLYEQADYALNFVKRSARGGIAFFSPGHSLEIRNASMIDQTLGMANLAAEMCLSYQPIVDSLSGRVVAFEALGRWNSPELGPVEPNIFIPAAERSGRINAITWELLSQMLRDMGQWPPHIRLSFNLSVHDISCAKTMQSIIALVAGCGQAPQRVDFEITETSVMHDFDQAARSLLALKDLGCGIALDDFGTGYASLSYVHKLPLDKIKVDSSFVIDLGRDRLRMAVTRSIMGLCDNLGLACVVEGIETDEQRRVIARLGSPLMQGFLFGRPMALDAALAFLDQEVASRPPSLPEGRVQIRL